MNRVKRIVFIAIILIIYMFTYKTYAALNCNVNLRVPKNKMTYNEQFSVYVAISNLQTTNGIIAIGTVVSYDTESLTLVNIEGQNGWSNPLHNTSNGKITALKNNLSTKNEDVIKITFKVNEKGKAKNSAWVKISDFEISDGEGEKNCGGSSINITIDEEKNTDTGNNNQGGNSNQGSNNSQEPNTKPENNNPTSGKTQTTRPSTGTSELRTGTTNPNTGTADSAENGSTNVQDENTNNEETSNNENNVDTNSIENMIEEDITNNDSENNNMLNVSENNGTNENKAMSSWIFYTICIAAVILIIGVLFVIEKYWKT